MGLPAYCNAADVRGAADLPITPAADRDIARAIHDGARAIESLCRGRHFYPLSGTFTIDWPSLGGVNFDSGRIWLDDNELISVSSLVVDDETITAYRLAYPNDEGEAYRALEMTVSGGESFSTSTNDFQAPISITGVRGFTNATEASGTLGTAIADTTDTTIQIGDTADIDVGDAILIDSESMIVTARTLIDTTENLAGALTVDSDDTTIAVADGTAYTAGELLTVDTERLEILDIAGNNLICRRAVDGTTLAAHSIGADIYARRGLTVERGALGTTAAVHSTTTVTVYKHTPPAGVRSLNIAEALVLLAQENAGYARTIGQGETEREARGVGLAEKRKQIRARYAIKGMVHAAGGRR
jgi:hypothetical protein